MRVVLRPGLKVRQELALAWTRKLENNQFNEFIWSTRLKRQWKSTAEDNKPLASPKKDKGKGVIPWGQGRRIHGRRGRQILLQKHRLCPWPPAPWWWRGRELSRLRAIALSRQHNRCHPPPSTPHFQTHQSWTLLRSAEQIVRLILTTDRLWWCCKTCGGGRTGNNDISSEALVMLYACTIPESLVLVSNSRRGTSCSKV